MPISKERAIQLIDQQLALVEEKRLSATYGNRYDDLYSRAIDGAEELIASLFGSEDAKKFRRKVHGITFAVAGPEDPVQEMQDYDDHMRQCITQLQIYKEKVENFWAEEPQIQTKTQPETIATIEQLARRLPDVIDQLGRRYDGRPTLTITDEHDIQDLIHTLLYLFFEDVRAEECTPSYAGGSSRMDILLGNEQTVIEVKKTRRGLGVKELREQLAIDMLQYQEHPNCKALVCIVYDRDRLIPNRKGVEKDLSKPINGMPVQTFIIQG